MKNSNKIDLTKEELFEILENIYNEVYVLDKNKNIIYVNPSCLSNYGMLPKNMIGKNHFEFTGNLWYPSVIDKVFQTKKPLCVEQFTYTGKKIISIANPVLDEKNEIEMVVCITEETFSKIDLKYNNEKKDEENFSSTNFLKDDDYSFVTNNNKVKKLFLDLKTAAKKDLSIFLHGESGTGKSMLAKYIHEISPRTCGPFLSINCSTLSQSLIESELFGYEPYAFSGANTKGKIGLIEAANHGTLFLDEITELPLSLQTKLLEVIEAKSFIPVGGKQQKKMDVRFVTATNKNIESCIKEKTFREDLFWRLNVMEFYLPPLRKRTEDIDELSQMFLNKFNKENDKHIVFSKEVINLFNFYNWPGNIRQLKNIVERGCIVTNDNFIKLEDLPTDLTSNIGNSYVKFEDHESFIEACKKYIINKAYQKNKSSRKIASSLEISQTKANNLIKKYIQI